MAETPGHFFIHFKLGHRLARRVLTGGEWDNSGRFLQTGLWGNLSLSR